MSLADFSAMLTGVIIILAWKAEATLAVLECCEWAAVTLLVKSEMEMVYIVFSPSISMEELEDSKFVSSVSVARFFEA